MKLYGARVSRLSLTMISHKQSPPMIRYSGLEI
uniref:Uncharacterized protein n=1 Tax=Rhizophora mucronata TaxID=61149 RepID=A0A2P2IP14_RHIMU